MEKQSPRLVLLIASIYHFRQVFWLLFPFPVFFLSYNLVDSSRLSVLYLMGSLVNITRVVDQVIPPDFWTNTRHFLFTEKIWNPFLMVTSGFQVLKHGISYSVAHLLHWHDLRYLKPSSFIHCFQPRKKHLIETLWTRATSRNKKTSLSLSQHNKNL